MRNSILVSLAAMLALLAASSAHPTAQGGQRGVWREVWTDGRALPKAVDVRDAPESRYYGYSVGRWENDNILVIDTTGLDERAWAETLCIPSEAIEYRDTLARPSGIDAR